VLKDVRNELLSPEKAAADYGVVVDVRRWAIDEAATKRRREEIRTARAWREVPKLQWHDPIPSSGGGAGR
jgi:N-methylhydantoinase B